MRWIVVDLETTGLKPEGACVWSVGAVVWGGGQICGSYSRDVRPEPQFWTKDHQEVVQRVSGLEAGELAILAWAPSVEVVAAEFSRWLGFWLGAGEAQSVEAWVTSYNVAFERSFLESAPWRVADRLASWYGLALPWGRCLMEAATEWLGGAGSRYCSLRRACEALGVPQAGSHRVIADCMTALGVGRRLGVIP